jgi:ABC-type polysaccharide/polyol phosphate transport system ATPase subunit
MHASIKVENLSVSFPLLRVDQKSLKKTLFKKVSFGKINFQSSQGYSVESLKGVTFDLNHGDRLGVIGSNGSGKSTLLRTLAGVYKPQSGSVKVDGEVTSIIEPSVGLDPFLNGYENIESRMVLLTKGLSIVNQSIIDKVEEISGLGHYLSLPLNTYSTGMIMRLNFAISIALRPQILLMDEWLSVTDKNFKTNAEKYMNEFVNSASILVLASHDLNLIGKICNKVLILKNGVPELFGPSEKVLRKYL